MPGFDVVSCLPPGVVARPHAEAAAFSVGFVSLEAVGLGGSDGLPLPAPMAADGVLGSDWAFAAGAGARACAD